MFSGWLKGIGASILNWLGATLVFYGFYLMGVDDNNSTKSLIFIIIGVVSLLIGSYLKYVSKQTVKTK